MNLYPTVNITPSNSDRTSGLIEFAALFKACGDPLRLEILRLLERDAFGVLELCSLFDVKQSAMSHHLKVLNSAGLVETQREGNSIFYRRPVTPPTLPADALPVVFSLIDSLPVSTDMSHKLSAVRQQRAHQSLAFFARHADDLQLHQERVADYDIYAGQVLLLLEKIRSPAWTSALEIGPGDGRFLLCLAGQFKHVNALDNSAEMLEKAKHLTDSHALPDIGFVLGDTQEGLRQGLQADLIVMNMVLHHIASPQAVLDDCAIMLQPGGSLIVSELGRHDQQWTREACGDLWLGFDSHELSRWAEQSGLSEGESLYLGVRNGFQVQIRQFIKASGTDKQSSLRRVPTAKSSIEPIIGQSSIYHTPL
jgi:DNA-binding transcriptional ArsR family regulator/SAM-dependent methyltransferase